jgi:uncharacterized membrane protein YkoI
MASENIYIMKPTRKYPTTYAIMLIIAATLTIGATTTTAALPLAIKGGINPASAQMSDNSNMMAGPAGSSNSSQRQSMMTGITGANITGSIPIFPTISRAIASQVHTSLVNASMTAEKTVGGDAHAVSSHLGVENGFLVYTIWTIDSNNNIHRVIVDAGDGTVLSNQQISMKEMMMRGGSMMGGGDDGDGMMMMMGPPSMGMMGPGMMMGHHGMMWKP